MAHQRTFFLSTAIQLAALVFSTNLCSGQSAGSQYQDSLLESSVDYIVGAIDELNTESSVHIESLMDELTYYLHEPVDLNTCNYEELEALPLLDPLTARNIIHRRKKGGSFSSLIDLLEIKTISLTFLERLKPFVYLSSPDNKKPLPERAISKPILQKRTTVISQSFSKKIDKSRGFNRPPSSGGFHGNAWSMFTRIASQSKNGVSLRAVIEKDPGEAIFWRPDNRYFGADHMALSLSFKGRSFINLVVLGEYSVHLGSGLLFSTPFGSRKSSASTTAPIRPFYTIRPQASRTEGLSLRGVAFQMNLNPRMKAMFFASKKRRDATLSQFSPDSLTGVTALPQTGLHRTNSEIEKKAQLQEFISAAVFTYNAQHVRLGLAAFSASYEYPFLFQGSPLPSSIEFTGRTLQGLSLFGNLHLLNSQIHWEIARSTPGSSAYLVTALFEHSNDFRMIFLWRRYSYTYYSLYGHGFGERSSANRNETGFYFGSRVRLSSHWEGNVYVDLYEFPNSYPNQLKQPYSGIESLIRLSYTPRTWWSVYAQHKFETKYKRTLYSASPVQKLNTISPLYNQSFKFRLAYKHSTSLKLRTHLEIRWSSFRDSIESGILLYQDLAINASKNTKIYLRFSIFDSKGNDTILYAFENDLQFKYGIRSFARKGIRNYILVQHALFKKASLEFKYSQTNFHQSTNIGTGNDFLKGNQIREISGQVVWRI